MSTTRPTVVSTTPPLLVNHLTRLAAQDGLDALRRRGQKGTVIHDHGGNTNPLVGRQMGVDAAADLITHSDTAITEKHCIETDGTRVLDPRILFDK